MEEHGVGEFGTGIDPETGNFTQEPEAKETVRVVESERQRKDDAFGVFAHRYMRSNGHARDFIQYQGGDVSFIRDVLLQPTPGNVAKLLDTDEQEWIDEELQVLTELKERFDVEYAFKSELYQQLQQKHRGNPLFKEAFSDAVPSHFVSVFHYTEEGRLPRISQEGLQPSRQALSPEELSASTEYLRANGAVDASPSRPGAMHRDQAVYAFADLGEVRSRMGKGGVVLELKVDPDAGLVAEAEYFTEFMLSLKRWGSESASSYADAYWESSVPLATYRTQPLAERLRTFTSFPEVLVQGPIPPAFIRVHSVETVS